MANGTTERFNQTAVFLFFLYIRFDYACMYDFSTIL